MPVDPDRHAQYANLRRRFVDDPEFRAALRADPETVLTEELGGLNEAERYWINGVLIERTSDSDLIVQIQNGDVHIQAW